MNLDAMVRIKKQLASPYRIYSHRPTNLINKRQRKKQHSKIERKKRKTLNEMEILHFKTVIAIVTSLVAFSFHFQLLMLFVLFVADKKNGEDSLVKMNATFLGISNGDYDKVWLKANSRRTQTLAHGLCRAQPRQRQPKICIHK